MQMIDSRSNAATGKALLAAMLIHCEACTPTAASTRYNPQPAGTGTGANGSGPYHASAHWQLLVSCLDRISDNWYGELRSHMKQNLLSWVKIEHFPLVLCKCRSFRSAIIGMLASSVVPEQQKQAIAKGLLQFNSAPLFAQIGFMAKVRPPLLGGKKKTTPDFLKQFRTVGGLAIGIVSSRAARRTVSTGAASMHQFCQYFQPIVRML